MGLLDKIGGHKLPKSMTDQEALMVFMVAAILCDGDVDDSEIARLRSLCARCPTFAGNSEEQDTQLINKAVHWLTSASDDVDRIDALFAIVTQSLSEEYRETAFAMACDIAFADGSVGADEEDFLTGIYQIHVQIPEDRAIAIMSTFASLYRP